MMSGVGKAGHGVGESGQVDLILSKNPESQGDPGLFYPSYSYVVRRIQAAA